MTNAIDKINTRIEVIDPFKESVNSLLVVVFPNSASKNFAFALNIAQLADVYAVTEVGGKTMNLAVFSRCRDQAGKAIALIKYANSWKGVMYFCRGKLLVNRYQIVKVIECFLESCSCRDNKAHCHIVIDDPFLERIQDMSLTISIRMVDVPLLKKECTIDLYSFPCKYLYNRFKFQKNHPSTPQDQVQAGGVEIGVDVCPNFNPDEFNVVGSRRVLKDIGVATKKWTR